MFIEASQEACYYSDEEPEERERVEHRLKLFADQPLAGAKLEEDRAQAQPHASVQRPTREKLLEEAKLAGPFQYSRMLHTLALPGSLPEKEQTIEEKIRSFFLEHVKVDIRGNFCPRTEPDYSNCVCVQDSLHLYGVDFMSTSRLVRYFGLFEPFKLEWVNNSACNAVFESPARARRAFLANLRYPNSLPAAHEPESFIIDDQSEPFFSNAILQQRAWYELKPYHQLGFERRVFARYATSLDTVNPFNLRNESFEEYLTAKKYFMRTKATVDEAIQLERRKRETFIPPHVRKRQQQQQLRGTDFRFHPQVRKTSAPYALPKRLVVIEDSD